MDFASMDKSPPSMPPNAEERISENFPLSGVVRCASDVPLLEENKERHYVSFLTSKLVRGKKTSLSIKRIGWTIKRRSMSNSLDYLWNECRSKNKFEWTDIVKEIPQKVEFDKEILEGQVHLRNASDHVSGDMSAVVSRLGASLALYSVTGRLTWKQISGGAPQSVRHLAYDDAYAAHFVHISESIEDSSFPAYVALVSAVCGEGGEVVLIPSTDAHPRKDSYRSFPGPNSVTGETLAQGVWKGLQILLSMYDASGASAVAGFALAKGIHSVLTIPSHTDEGGYTREVLRVGRFARPYGVISARYLKGNKFLPSFSLNEGYSLTALVDGIALKTAACTALADPLVKLNAHRYPSILRATKAKKSSDGSSCGIQENEYLRKALSIHSCEFATNLVSLWGELVGRCGALQVAAEGLIACFNIASDSGCMTEVTFKGAVIAPFYWIEPTGLFENMDKSDATLEGHGLLCGTAHERKCAAYPDMEDVLTDGSTMFKFKFRSVRSTPGFVHIIHNPEGGIENVVPVEVDPDRFGIIRTESHALQKSIRERVMAGDSLSSFVRVSGTSQLPAPAEVFYTGGSAGFKLVNFENNPVPSWASAIRSQETKSMDLYVCYSVSVPYLVLRPATPSQY